MIKSICLLIILSFTSHSLLAKKYVLVGLSGFGTNRSGNKSQPSGAHDNLPYYHPNIHKRIELVHGASAREMNSVIELFNCGKGRKNKNIGLILLVNSWGARKGNLLATKYYKECGVKVDAFYLVDGVAKPIGPYRKKIQAKKCFSYYQSKGVVRGDRINGCINKDFTNSCYGLKGVQCHIKTEWDGTSTAREHMLDHYLNN